MPPEARRPPFGRSKPRKGPPRPGQTEECPLPVVGRRIPTEGTQTRCSSPGFRSQTTRSEEGQPKSGSNQPPGEVLRGPPRRPHFRPSAGAIGEVTLESCREPRQPRLAVREFYDKQHPRPTAGLRPRTQAHLQVPEDRSRDRSVGNADPNPEVPYKDPRRRCMLIPRAGFRSGLPTPGPAPIRAKGAKHPPARETPFGDPHARHCEAVGIEEQQELEKGGVPSTSEASYPSAGPEPTNLGCQ